VTGEGDVSLRALRELRADEEEEEEEEEGSQRQVVLSAV
jgi:hypothetical protein